MQTLFGTIFGVLWLTNKSFIFYSCNAKLVLYNINCLIHAFLKYPNSLFLFYPYMKSTHFENFSKRTPAFAGVVGGLFLKLMPTHCHVALVDRF